MDEKNGVYGIKYTFPSRIDYFFFSEKLKEEKIESSLRKTMIKYEEAKLLQECLDKNTKLPAGFCQKQEQPCKCGQENSA